MQPCGYIGARHDARHLQRDAEARRERCEARTLRSVAHEHELNGRDVACARGARTHEQIEAKGGVVLGLDTQDASRSAIDFLAEHKATFPSLRDRDRSYGREFGVTGSPETFLIDRRGRIAALQRMPVTQAWLDQHLPKLLAEQA